MGRAQLPTPLDTNFFSKPVTDMDRIRRLT